MIEKWVKQEIKNANKNEQKPISMFTIDENEEVAKECL